jgi:hypothetical protein
VPHDRPTRGTPSLESWAREWGTPVVRDRASAPSRNAEQLADDVRKWPTPLGHQADQGQGGGEFAKFASRWPTATEGDSRLSGRHTTTTDVMHPGTSLTDASRSFPQAPQTGEDGSAYSTLVERISSLGLSRSLNWRFQWWLMGMWEPADLRCREPRESITCGSAETLSSPPPPSSPSAHCSAD